jgi:hypothetical protein
MFSTFGGYGSGPQFFDGFGAAVEVLAGVTLLGVIPALMIPRLRPRRAEALTSSTAVAAETRMDIR